jgi:DNA adenine methylase
MKKYKTPLRYPGGKSRATKILLEYIPERYCRYVEPFIGGGSMAIAMQKARPDLQITINDLYTPLYAFWMILRDEGPKLSQHLFQTKAKLSDYENKDDVIKAHKDAFLLAKERLNSDDISLYEMAYYFYICNKCSFSGLSESSSFSAQASQNNFNESGINSLPYYHQLIRNWDIRNDDYQRVLDEEAAFNFLDPPYLIKDNLYGKKGDIHKSFDHQRMADFLNKDFQGMTMITYNSSPEVEALYPNWSKLQWDLTYTMRSTGTYGADQDKRKELLLVNYGIDNSNKQWYR